FTGASCFLWIVLGLRKLLRSGVNRKNEGAGGEGGGKSGKSSGKSGKSLTGLLVLALFGFTPQAGLYFVTVKMLAPGITSLLLYLYPAFVLLLSALFLGKKPSKGQLAALAMSLFGCLLTFFKPGKYPILGLLLGVLVAMAYGIYLVVGEKILAGFDPLFSTAVIMTVAGTVYWALLIAGGMPLKAPSSAKDWLFVAGIALVATVLPITTLFSAMSRVGAANTSLISTIEPVSTVLLSVLFLGEELTAGRIWGGAFIVGGVVALRVFSRSRPQTESNRN
ncbi:MAG TPA: DMT family transporter, partial [Rectinemataceae bacterium]|nr:DMT family transporter [Rectinemataceae bacterium]